MSGKRPIAGPVAVKVKVKRRKPVAKPAAQKSGQAAGGGTVAKGKKPAKRAKEGAAPGKAAVAVTSVKATRAAAKLPDKAKIVRTQRGQRTDVPAKPERNRASKRKSAVVLARFAVGDVVRHKFYPFRGVIFDIDPVFANTDDWWLSIPERMRPKKNQPFYHLLAENTETEYIAYVSEQNLLPDVTGVPVRHPQVAEYFVEDEDGRYRPVFMTMLN